MSASTNNKGIFRSMLHTPALFVLAFLVLFLSCPIKKILQTEISVQASPRAAQSLTASQTGVNYLAASSCCLEKKIAVINDAVRQDQLPAISESVHSVFSETGHQLFYYLSGLQKVGPSSSRLTSFSVPLFLRQSKLLI